MLLREGSNHSWWHQPELNRRSAIPSHSEIKELLARKICIDLGVPLLDRCDHEFGGSLRTA